MRRREGHEATASAGLILPAPLQPSTITPMSQHQHTLQAHLICCLLTHPERPALPKPVPNYLPAATSPPLQAQMYLDMFSFPNSYTFGKNLTEKLVADFHKQCLPVAIVRPTLVCGLAGAPYPGYCGNLAGKQTRDVGGAECSSSIK